MASSEHPTKKAKLLLQLPAAATCHNWRNQDRNVRPKEHGLRTIRVLQARMQSALGEWKDKYHYSGRGRSSHFLNLFDLTWIYTGDIKNNEEYISINEKPVPSAATLKSHWMQLVRCFVLGEMLVAINFKNVIIDLLFSKTDVKYLRTSWLSILDIDIIEQVFIGTPQGSPLRRYILEACFLNIQSDHPLWNEM
ncbi:hypothetical protein ACEPPN_017318 [Leptodophora sp. 'Broadleaf-Isolate-01']